MNFLVDTTLLIDFLRKKEKAVLFLESQNPPQISVISLAEIYKGVKNKKELTKIKKLLLNFKIYPLSLAISNLFINLLEQYRLSHGLLILDALIAATAIENNLILVTSNIKHFQMIKNLKLKKY